ncbi:MULTISPECIES: hypothetical protein [unclassified Leisingera]|uniref:hypothetical protein n=1 Tax=unclassified Leisingera TaxID=2614906 RepID=UPI00057E0A65|nr:MULTISPECIES: hypothetical protein [unclassified Leisingera]KIC16743.1 hypothetical protein RA21_11060 [Leisingera sp. ANG-DT]KIC29369.1 hypothetical protein RA24_07125 [Leisingera sp. ANG-M6]KIC34503.1 hypothetical protein RA25_01545 [Leisingera sp. ANG-S5]
MTRPNPNFDLTVEDVDLIETALCQSQKILSHRHLSYEHGAQIEGGANAEKAVQTGEMLSRIRNLLSRLQVQKADGTPAASLS